MMKIYISYAGCDIDSHNINNFINFFFKNFEIRQPIFVIFKKTPSILKTVNRKLIILDTVVFEKLSC